jgi:thiamine-phosphate pyrophosphorylase
MTDPRIDDVLLRSVQALPAGSGVVLRHDRLAAGERRALFLALRRIARRRGLRLLVKADARTARRWRADGVHLGTPPLRPRSGAPGALPVTVAVHDRRELARTRRLRPALLFVSPVHVTRSHRGAAALGATGLRRIAAKAGLPVIALGGMTSARGRMMARIADGWAAIDGLAAPRRSR